MIIVGLNALPRPNMVGVECETGKITLPLHAVVADNERGMSSHPANAFIARWILETLCAMGQAHKGKTKGTYLP
jgi:hypothetical protein